MRMNTFDCAVYHHSNLVPEYYEIDDYQVRTPTDIIGQHIHLPKWDLTTTDGAAQRLELRRRHARRPARSASASRPSTASTASPTRATLA